MLSRLHERGWTGAVVVLMALTPLLCCCGMTMSEARAAANESDEPACSNCEPPRENEHGRHGQHVRQHPQPDSPAPSPNHSHDCECEHQTLVLMTPGQSGTAHLAAIDWNVVVALLDDATATLQARPGPAADVASAVSPAERRSLLALRTSLVI